MLIVFTYCCSCNYQKNNAHILKPLIGFDNVNLATLSIKDIITKHGNNFRIDTFYSISTIPTTFLDTNSTIIKTKLHSYRICYDSLGISYYFNHQKNNITALRVQYPFNGITDKGVILNKSTFNEIEKLYGAAPWQTIDNYIMKEYEGIYFYRPFHDTISRSNISLNKYFDSIVTEITILGRKTSSL